MTAKLKKRIIQIERNSYQEGVAALPPLGTIIHINPPTHSSTIGKNLEEGIQWKEEVNGGGLGEVLARW